MKTYLLIFVGMVVALPAAAQDTEVETSGAGEFETEVEEDNETSGAGEYEEPLVEEVAPIAYTHRSMTVPSGTLRIDFGPADRALLHANSSLPLGASGLVLPLPRGGGFTYTGVDGGDALIDLRLGAAIGIVDGLEVGAMFLPLGLAPDGRDTYGNPTAYARLRIVDGDFQLGAQVGAAVPVVDGTDFGLGIAVPIKLVLGNGLHLNTGAEVQLTFADPDMVIGLNIPVEFAFNLTEGFFAGLTSGFVHGNLDGGDPVIPAGVFAGYSLSLGNGMVLDATVDFRLPWLINTADDVAPGVSAPGGFDVWQLTVGGVMRMDLL